MTNRNDRKDIFGNLGDGKKHTDQRRKRHARRPCGGNSPAVPANLTFTWDVVEKSRGHRLQVLLGWDPVRANTSGAGALMRRYYVQMQRSTDGTTRTGRTRRYVVRETTVTQITAASIVAGTTAEFTLDKAHALDSGDTVVVSGMTPAGYNGTWTVTTTPTAKTFRADIGTSPGAGSAFGEAHENTTDLEVRAVRKHVWYRFRVQAENTGGCIGDWSAWTSWTLANDHVAPPTPTNVKIYATSTNRIVVDWDMPTQYLPTEGLVAATGTTTLTGTSTFFNAQIGIGTKIRIGAAGDVRTVTAIASDTSLTVDSAFTTFSGQVAFIEEPDPDVAFADVWIDTTVGFDPPAYKRDRFHHASRISVRPADLDLGSTFYGRVRLLDASRNRSAWIPATIAGNSLSGTTPDGVTVGSGGGGVVATFTKMGRLRVKHYSHRRWVNPTGKRLTFKKARATVGDREAGTGAPTGADVKVNARRWLTPETSSSDPIWASDDTLRITAGTYKDVNGPGTFDLIGYLDPDEALTITVKQVGSTFPGEELTVQFFMEP
jgi:hypothetical protein